MLFNSPEFFLFLAIVLALYYSLSHRYQNYMLLVASYLFYSFWDYRYLSLILLSTGVDYFVSHAISRTSVESRRKLLLILSILVNLGVLGFFKYYGFFIDNAARVLSYAGLEPNLPILYFLLPVGISFYTFQTMAYTIDVYKGKMKPVDNIVDFSLYVCYFPQLVAGPIERPQNLVPALQRKRTVTTEMFTTGCVLILIGLFRKVVIADAIGMQVDPVFGAPESYSTPIVLKALYLFALQIYCDFAGYSDIARGTSRLLGIELMQNFNQPYFAANISEFWRRWHISLSTWLRDYLYIPLGGNRGGLFNTNRNLMLTMLLGGLWHGAAWSFVVWGGLHGLYLIGYRMLGGSDKPSEAKVTTKLWSWKRIASVLLTFHLVLITWIFFRAPGISMALTYIRQILAFEQMDTLATVLPAIIMPWLLVMLIDIPQYWSGKHTFILQWSPLARNAVIAVILFFILLGIGSRAPFIYFQF